MNATNRIDSFSRVEGFLLDPVYKKILYALRHEPLTTSQIANELIFKNLSQTNHRLKLLEQQGIVYRLRLYPTHKWWIERKAFEAPGKRYALFRNSCTPTPDDFAHDERIRAAEQIADYRLLFHSDFRIEILHKVVESPNTALYLHKQIGGKVRLQVVRAALDSFEARGLVTSKRVYRSNALTYTATEYGTEIASELADVRSYTCFK